MNIGDILLRLLADDSGFEADVVKKADKAGAAGEKTLGARIGGALKSKGVQAFGAAASAAFAVASAGALKLSDINARLQAETGASADEAKAAGKVINKVAGRERTDLDAVADAAIAVRRDLGAVGDEANDLTEDFTRYARVTKQGPAAAVSAFDDILDAWNLTADKSGEIMDKLVVSGQKYGGTIEADQAALSAMAPQLKAFNLGIDDGIALLDLFKSSGLDIAEIPKALNTAFQKLDGRPLQDVFRELAAIEDPAKRAQRAVEIFGSKAGLKLANAIQPGIDSLDDFKIGADEATDATQKAADIIDSTPWAKVQRFFSEAAASLRDIGDDYGPLITGLASAASLLGSQLGKQLFEAGKSAGGALIDGIGTATGAAGTIIGNFFASRIEAILDPKNNTILGRVVRASAAKVGILYGATMAASSRLAEAIGGVIDKVPGSSKVKSALTRTGTALGGPLGLALGLTAATVFVTWFIQELNRRRDEVAAAAGSIGDAVAYQIQHGTVAQLEQSQAAIKSAIDAIVAETSRGVVQVATPEQLDALRALVAQYNAIQTELNARAQANARATEYALNGAKQGTATAVTGLLAEIPKGMEKSRAQIAAAARDFLAKPIGEQLRLIGPAGLRAGANLALELASGLRQQRGDVDSAVDQLREDLKNRLKPKKRVARDIGLLFGKDISKGLKDSDPVIKAQAEGTRGLIEAELIETIKAGGKAGEQIQAELEKKLKSKDPDVRKQAQRTKSLIDAALKDPSGGKTPGDKIVDGLTGDIRQGQGPAGRAAYNLGREIGRQVVRGVNNTGYLAPGTTNGSTGFFSGKQVPIYHEGVTSVPNTGPAIVQRGEIIVPSDDASAIRSGAAVLGSVPAAHEQDSGDVFNLYLPDARHTDPWAVLDRVPRYVKRAKAEASDSGWKAA